MLVEVQIIQTETPKKTYIAFNSAVRPRKGDTTIGLNSICSVEDIVDMLDHEIYILSDGSKILNPLKIIGDIENFNIKEPFFNGSLYISCEGSQKNPILSGDGKLIDLINFG